MTLKSPYDIKLVAPNADVVKMPVVVTATDEDGEEG